MRDDKAGERAEEILRTLSTVIASRLNAEQRETIIQGVPLGVDPRDLANPLRAFQALRSAYAESGTLDVASEIARRIDGSRSFLRNVGPDMDRLRCMFSEHRAGTGDRDGGRPYVFALLPLTIEFKATYEECIKPVLSDLGCEVEHAQELETVDAIVDAVFAQISKATFLVADTTGRNANVLYEVGYAHGIGKKVIFLVQDVRDIPFDIRGLRHIVYQSDRLNALSLTLKGTGLRLLKELYEG